MIKKLHLALLFTVGALIAGPQVQAGSVDAKFVEIAAGQWQLQASISGADITGLGGFDFEVVGTPSAGVSWVPGKIYYVDPDTFDAGGFRVRGAQAVGPDRFSVVAAQDLGAPTSLVPGLGMTPTMIDGAGANDIILDVPAILGTLTTPAGLTAANFSAINFYGLPPAGGTQSVPIIGADLNVEFEPFGGPGGDAEFASTPDDGGLLDFGYGAAQRTRNLAVRNVGDDGTTITVQQAVLSGADAGLFSVVGFSPLTLNANAGDSNIVVQFNGIGTPGIYNAELTLLDDTGATLGMFDLTAAVPEPSTVALAGLGLVGLVGFLRRRG